MANPLQAAGALSEQSNFAPLRTESIFTGLFTNRSVFRDGTTQALMAQYYGSRLDPIADGENTEISAHLTLRRRPGLNIYNTQIFPPIKRFYTWNQFTLTEESIMVLADTAATVYDATGIDKNGNHVNIKNPLFQKSAGAGSTYFIAVGNTLYFANGVDNRQISYPSMAISNWGIAAPTVAPTVSQTARPVDYPQRANNTVYGAGFRGQVVIYDPNTNTLQRASVGGTTGTAPPVFSAALYSTVGDGSVVWATMGNPSTSAEWHNNYSYAFGDMVIGHVSTGATTTTPILFALYDEGSTGISGNALPNWTAGLGTITHESTGVQWINLGTPQQWTDLGQGATVQPGIPLSENIPYMQGFTTLDPNGYLQSVGQIGKTAATTPTSWATALNAQTTDGNAIWINQGPLAIAATAAAQYGYAYMNSATGDISNMSPASANLTLDEGNQVVITGPRSSDPQVDTVIVYRTLQGGSTFFQLARIANPASGNWTFNDVSPDSALTISLQALINGEGTPLPSGATCLEYHLGRIFAAVGNVVYVSSGPDAIVSGSSGNAGFDTTFTCQSKITRFWVNAVGLAVFTVRDAYMILGDGASTPLYIQRWIDNLPLLSYDCFTTHLTTPYLFTGKRMIGSLDPGAGIIESSFPIADLMTFFDPASCYLTFHAESSAENALYITDGGNYWYRMAPTSAPEVGFTWNPRAHISGGMSCVQSVEITPGQYRLLLGPPAAGGPISMRDLNSNTDDGTPYEAYTVFGSSVLASPGQLAGLAWMTLEATATGTAPALSALIGEVDGQFESIPRHRQDPPNLPPSESLYSNRHSFLQSQRPVWCRHFQFRIDWPAEDAANELLAFTIFGQTWNEMRGQ